MILKQEKSISEKNSSSTDILVNDRFSNLEISEVETVNPFYY